MVTYLCIGLWVLKVYIKRRDENHDKAKIFKDIEDDDIENIVVWIAWPYVVNKWWFGKKNAN